MYDFATCLQVHLPATQFTNRSSFDRRRNGASAVESLKPRMHADARGCWSVSSALIGVHRRFPSRRYEDRSLFIVSESHTAESDHHFSRGDRSGGRATV